jgi:biotin carboxylase
MTRAPAIIVVDPILSGAPFVAAVRGAGYRLITIVSLPAAFFRPPLAPPAKDDADLYIASRDAAAILAELACSPFEVRAVIAGAEAGVALADRLGHTLGVRHNDPTLPGARRNKHEMKEAARAAGLLCARSRRCRTRQDLAGFVARHGYPVVIKTPEGASTSQVYRCDDWGALVDGFEHILGQPNIFLERAPYALVEEYLVGNEYVVDTFTDESGVHVTDVWRYRKVGGPQGDNLYYDTIQVPNDAPETAALANFACALTRAVGIRVGPAHAELKLTPAGPAMIEIGARPAGGLIPLLGRETSGFDLYRATVEAHTEGRARQPWPVRHQRTAWLVDEPVPAAGVVTAVRGLDAIRALPSYVRHGLSVAVGDAVRPSSSLHDMALLVCLAHADRAVVARDAAAAHAAFTVEVAPWPMEAAA